MTDVRGWLDTRQPPPPKGLRDRMDPGGRVGAAEPLEPLLEQALEALDQARGSTGRVRESALELLTADALLTYACEAALERPDPGAALARILEGAGANR